MVEISLSRSGEGPGWATAPGYSTARVPARSEKVHSVNAAGRVRGAKLRADLENLDLDAEIEVLHRGHRDPEGLGHDRQALGAACRRTDRRPSQRPAARSPST